MARPPATCHPDCEHRARGLCESCYGKCPDQRRKATEAQRKRRASDPAFKANNRAQNLRKTYGITSEQYDAMLAEQGGGCAICGVTPDEVGYRLNVDHDHATGEVRGVLCIPCNVLLDRLEEGDWVGRANAYLARSSPNTC